MTRHSNSGKNISGSGVAATKVIHFAACLILLCVICPPAPAQRGTCPALSFGPAINTPIVARTAGKPAYLAIGDFDRDGKEDVSVTTSQNVLLFLGDGTGHFKPPTTIPYALGSTLGFLTVGDFNKDGRPDLAVIDTDTGKNTGTGNISILLGNGDGSFHLSTAVHAGTSANHIAVGDFNADGNPDMVVTYYSAAQVKVYLGNGSGGFFPRETTLPTKIGVALALGGASVVVGDFNRDGKQDFAVALSKGAIITFQGDGTGLKFDQKAELPLADPITVTVGDFDQDGKLDLASASFVAAKLFIWHGDGAGNFGPPDIFTPLGATSLTPSMVAASDFNLDGKPDLVASTLNNVVEIVVEPATGGTVQLPTFTAGGGVFVGDFNQDGRPDIATLPPNGSISILPNTSKCCF